MYTNKQSDWSDTIANIVKWGVGIYIGWQILPEGAKEDVRRFVGQLGSGLAAYQKQQAELERQREIKELFSGVSFKPISGSPTLAQLPHFSLSSPVVEQPDNLLAQLTETDTAWRLKIVHPSVVLILGKRGSGKSALGYRLLELYRYAATPYVIGVPSSARTLLPDWIGIVPTLEDLPTKSIALVDEAYLAYHARGSMAAASKAMSQALNLSRQKEQTLTFVSSEARQVDKNIASSANVIVFKDLGMLQLEFDRPELNKLATQAKEAFATIKGDRRRSAFVYAPDTDFLGLLENELPTFWKPSLSHLFAAGSAPSIPRSAKRLTPQEKAQKAREMRSQGASYGEICRALGVKSRSTIQNYLKGYWYERKNSAH